MKFPVWVNRNCRLAKCEGKIIIDSPVQTGMIQIGFEDVGIFDNKKSAGVWRVNGTVVFQGAAKIGHGCKINVGRNGVLSLGEAFYMPSESTIICHKKITIGKNCGFSWDVLIMDSDLHHIYDSNDNVINYPAEIFIGDNVWLGCRAMVMKGVSLPPNNIVAASALVARSFDGENQIIAGNPARVIRENVRWDPRFIH